MISTWQQNIIKFSGAGKRKSNGKLQSATISLSACCEAVLALYAGFLLATANQWSWDEWAANQQQVNPIISMRMAAVDMGNTRERTARARLKPRTHTKTRQNSVRGLSQNREIDYTEVTEPWHTDCFYSRYNFHRTGNFGYHNAHTLPDTIGNTL